MVTATDYFITMGQLFSPKFERLRQDSQEL